MLQNKIMTQEERQTYMAQLKSWLNEVRDTPVEEMTDFFAKRISEYENVHLNHWPEEYAHIASFFKQAPGTLLDIGCGTGLELEAVYKRFPDVKITGIDLSEEMVEKLQKKYKDKKLETIIADYFEYPFGENKYDAALSFETLHHFKYEKKQLIYNKLFQAIKHGGYYIECDYIACCEEEEKLCLEQYQYRRKKYKIPDNIFIHIDIPLTLSHQTTLMKNAGFQNVNVLYQNGSTVIIRAEK